MILHQNSIAMRQHVAYFQSLKNIEATLGQFVDEELVKGERERIGAKEIERNWFCDLWGREEDKVRDRYMKSSLIIWAPPTWWFYKNATVFIFYIQIHFCLNWKWILSIKTQPNQFFGSGSHKKLKMNTENNNFFPLNQKGPKFYASAFRYI